MDNFIEELMSQMTARRGLWIGLHTDVEAYLELAGYEDLRMRDPHVTVMHLGRGSAHPPSDDVRVIANSLTAVVAKISTIFEAFDLEFDGIARFVDRGRDGEGDPIVVLVGGLKPHAIRDAVRAELIDRGVPLATKILVARNSYIPHVTLGRTVGNLTLGPARASRMPRISSIGVTCGEAHRRYPLKTA